MLRYGVDYEPPHPTNIEDARPARRSTHELKMASARNKVDQALRRGGNPGVTDTRNIPLGNQAIVFRIPLNNWNGPFHVIDVVGDTVVLLMPSPEEPSQFRLTAVRPYLPEKRLPLLPTLELDEEVLVPTEATMPPNHGPMYYAQNQGSSNIWPDIKSTS